MSEIQLSTIEEALEDFKAGKFVIVVDDEDRENEGDLITAAELITPEKINYMLQQGRGVLCAPVTKERCRQLELEHQVQSNTSVLGTPSPLTVDLLEDVPLVCRHTTAPRRFAPWPIRMRAPNGSDAPDISARSTPKTAESSPVPDILRPLSTWLACLAFSPWPV